MFDATYIQSYRNGSSLVTGYREDLAAGDVIGLQLTSMAGVQSYRWEIQGRPEGSAAGGKGPEPIQLSRSPRATFVVDTDRAPTYLDGSYLISCTINEGGIAETKLTTKLVRKSSLTLSDGRSLHHLAATEDLEANTATVAQGYATMANRWLRKLYNVAGSQPGSSYYGYRQAYPSVVKGTVTGPYPDLMQFAGMTAAQQTTQPSNTPVANQFYLVPIQIWKSIIVSDLWVNPTSGFNTINFRMGIYSNIPGGAYPYRLHPTLNGTFQVLAGGGYRGFYDQTVILTPGIWWWALVLDSGVTGSFSYWPWFRPGDCLWPLLGYGALTQGSNQDVPGIAWTYSFPYAALPDPFPTASPVQVGSNNLSFPGVWIRFKETS